MSVRGIASGMAAGLLAPNNWDKMLSQKVGLVTHFGYYIKDKNTAIADNFLMRVEQEDDADGELVRVEAFTDEGVFA